MTSRSSCSPASPTTKPRRCRLSGGGDRALPPRTLFGRGGAAALRVVGDAVSGGVRATVPPQHASLWFGWGGTGGGAAVGGGVPRYYRCVTVAAGVGWGTCTPRDCAPPGTRTPNP